MRWLTWTFGILAAIALLVIGTEVVARLLDPATADERAVLDSFVSHVGDKDCVPGWTSAVHEAPRDRRWVEADDRVAAQIEAAARSAPVRDAQLATVRGWLLPRLASLWVAAYCTHPIRVSAPTFSGNYAFVTAATDRGVSTSAFVRDPDGWAWVSAVWDDEGIIVY